MKKREKKKLVRFIVSLIFVLAVVFYEGFLSFPEESGKTTTNDDVQLRQDGEDIEPVNRLDGSNLKIYFVDVGQADCILIDVNGEYALIDAGNNEDGSKLVTYFHSLGIQSFQYLIGTHAHEDHIGGMDDIIRNFSAEHFYMPDAITTTKTFEDVLDALEEKQLAFETPEVDSTFSLADAKFQVLYVGSDKNDLNDTSIVLKMTYQDTSYLFTGDATGKVEKGILEKNLKSDVLKVGHHGSQYSSTAQFLKKVEPKYAIIQVGEGNSYEHPRQVTLDKLEKIGTKIYRTDRNGTIILSSDGRKISFETLKTDTNG